MILNYILLKNNYPPLVIKTKARKEYLASLREADKSDLIKAKKENYEKLIVFVAEQMLQSYWNIFL